MNSCWWRWRLKSPSWKAALAQVVERPSVAVHHAGSPGSKTCAGVDRGDPHVDAHLDAAEHVDGPPQPVEVDHRRAVEPDADQLVER